jgi:hypothetical protein
VMAGRTCVITVGAEPNDYTAPELRLALTAHYFLERLTGAQRVLMLFHPPAA